MNRLSSISLAVLVAVGCSEDSKQPDVSSLRRDRGDAAPVVMVDRKPSTTVSLAKADVEVEPNDTVGAATQLELPGAFKGTLNSSNDVDLYKFTPATSGMLGVRLPGIEAVDLKLSLQDATGEVVIAVSDRGPAETEEGFPNFPVIKGQTYILAVTEFIKPSKKSPRRKKKGKAEPDTRPAREGESAEYTLACAMQEPERNHELEPNDAATGAKDVLLGDELFGYIGWTGDVDTWKLALSGFGKSFGLDLSIQGVDGVSYKLEVLDAAGKSVLSREGGKGRPVFLRGVVPKEGESHYIARLSANRSNPQQPYSLKIGSREIDAETEVEPNDASGAATTLGAADEDGAAPTEGVMRGFLLGGDVDYYMFKAGKDDVVLDVSVSAPNSVDIKLSVRAGGKTDSADNGKSGATEDLSDIAVKAGKVAYVVIKGSFDGDSAEPYELRWSVSAGQPADPQTPDLDDFDKDFE